MGGACSQQKPEPPIAIHSQGLAAAFEEDEGLMEMATDHSPLQREI